jgi:hypothetical protein
MEIKKFNEYDINEEVLPRFMMEDEGNKKAMRSYTDNGPKTEYHITTSEPISITTKDDVDVAKFKILLNRYDIKFDIKELDLN